MPSTTDLQNTTGDPAPTASPPAPLPGSPEALIEEARRRQRRRRRRTVAVVVALLVSVVVGIVVAGGSGPRAPSTRPAPPVDGGGPVTVRSLAIPGPFTPEQMVTAAGKVWLVGTTSPDDERVACAIESVDPATLRTRRFPLPGCGVDAVVGGGRIYLATLSHVSGTNTSRLRIERFDPATGRATVRAPVDMTLSGSSDAHTTMAYGHGSLWLWGYATGGHGTGPPVVEISPSTGAVTRTVTRTPPIGGGQPFMVATATGLWLAGGPGTSTVDRLAWGASEPSTVYAGKLDTSVVWLSATGGRVWAAVATDHGDDPGRVTSRLVAMDTAGHRRTGTSPAPTGGTPPVGSDGRLWVVGSTGSSCADPLRLWRIDTASGTGTAVLPLPTTVEPCLANSAVATTGSAVFALVGDGGDGSSPAVLYRVSS